VKPPLLFIERPGRAELQEPTPRLSNPILLVNYNTSTVTPLVQINIDTFLTHRVMHILMHIATS
jgi:hypothetical protein